MLAMLSRAIDPTLSLSAAINRWDTIRHQLAEPPRKRRSQRVKARCTLS
jgi:hypothetical protein